MRLKRFYIEHYRVLDQLDLHFERTPPPLQERQAGYALDFLVGVNGTGKSTVLRLLGRVVTQLHTEEGRFYEFDVPLTLSYEIERGGNLVTVTLSNIPEEIGWEGEGFPPIHYLDNGDWINGTEKPLVATDYLPSLVVYSTGNLTEWRELLQTEQVVEDQRPVEEDERNDLAWEYEWPAHSSLPTKQEPLKGTRFVEPQHLPLVALCGLLADRWDDDAGKRNKLAYVLAEAQIEELLGFALRVRYLEGLHDEQSVKDVIDELAPLAKRVIRQGNDWHLVFELDDQPLGSEKWFGDVYERPIQLFNALYRLALDEGEGGEALQDVALFLRRRARPRQAEKQGDDQPAEGEAEQPMLHLFRWLSDGERSLIARMALFSLFRVDNHLILLDEPEVHFNDVWKRELVNVLDQVMTGYRSHTLITTHSSIALTDVPRASIRVMERDGTKVTGEPQPPRIQTFGADPSDVLVHVFGTPSATGERSIQQIQKELINADEAKLDKLAEVVAPGYWRYRIQLEKRRMQEVTP